MSAESNVPPLAPPQPPGADPAPAALPLRSVLILFAALAALGVLGNLARLPLFFGVEMLFGSVASMLALMLLGARAGVVVALAASAVTVWIWNHPYAMVIFGAEAAVVGWLHLRRRVDFLMADALYWALVGVPLVYLFYLVVMGVPAEHVHVTALKQALNSLANALAARLLWMGFGARVQPGLRFSMRELVFNALFAFVMLPSILIIASQTRDMQEESAAKIRDTLLATARESRLVLENWLRQNQELVNYLAGLAATRTPAQMQQALDQARATRTELLRCGYFDAQGTSLAFSPTTDVDGQTTIGRNFARPELIERLARERTPLLSDVTAGRTHGGKPIVLALAPVIRDGTYAGYTAAVMDLQGAADAIELSTSSAAMPGMRFELFDKAGRTILGNGGDRRLGALRPVREGTITAFPGGVEQWIPALKPNVTLAERWKLTTFRTRVEVGRSSRWQLEIEVPVAPQMQALLVAFGDLLAQLCVLLALALVVANLLSRWVIASLASLGRLTADVAHRVAYGQPVRWMKSPIDEVRGVMEDFRGMASELAARFEEVRRFNERLEREVAQRTHDLAMESRRLQTLLATATDGIHVLDAEGRLVECSESFLRMLGRERAEMGRLMVAHWEAGASGERFSPDWLAAREARTVETRYRRADGTTIDVEVGAKVIRLGGQDYLYASARDVGDRKRAEETVRRTAEEYRGLLAATLDGFMVLDDANRLVEVNDALCRMVGYPREELLGLALSRLEEHESVEAMRERTARAIEAGGMQYEARFRRRDLLTLNVEVGMTWVRASRHLACFVRDVSERRRLEEARLASQRMESLGTLAGGIAHDFNNILAAIRGNADLAAEEAPREGPVAQSLEEIRKASERAAELVRRIMAFGRPKDSHRDVVVLERVLGEVLALLRSTLPAGVELACTVDPDAPGVYADASQVHEAIVNLTTNAAYAIGARPGRIRYRIDAAMVEPALAARLAVAPGRYARLSVSDNGCGIDPSTRARIFDAFFTTKPPGDGTGLGLSMVHGIMRSHGGAVTVESEPGEGATFTLHFPAASEGAPRAAPATPPAPAPGTGGRRLLYVDDEEALVLLASRALTRLGYHVTGHTNPEAAVHAFESDPDRFDVVVTDLSMPQMSGFDVARRVLACRPGMAVIMMTGYVRAEDEVRAREVGIRHVVPKPSTVQELARVVDRTLAGEAGPD